jgi:hypothetical protein
LCNNNDIAILNACPLLVRRPRYEPANIITLLYERQSLERDELHLSTDGYFSTPTLKSEGG